MHREIRGHRTRIFIKKINISCSVCSSFEYHLIVFSLRRKSNCSCSVQSFFWNFRNEKNHFKANIWKVSHWHHILKSEKILQSKFYYNLNKLIFIFLSVFIFILSNVILIRKLILVWILFGQCLNIDNSKLVTADLMGKCLWHS